MADTINDHLGDVSNELMVKSQTSLENEWKEVLRCVGGSDPRTILELGTAAKLMTPGGFITRLALMEDESLNAFVRNSTALVIKETMLRLERQHQLQQAEQEQADG